MTGYKTTEQIFEERFTTLTAIEREEFFANECCTACRRGTRALGKFPCGAGGLCRCHGLEAA